MKTALLIIATGEKYHQYVNPLLASAREFFVDHTPIVWTDSLAAAGTFDSDFVIIKEPLGYPNETLYRYHTILEQRRWLDGRYDQLFYIDVDMRFVAPVGEEIFSSGITATLHPGYVGECGTPERNPDSTAMIPFNVENKYYCGGFNGGDADQFLKMATLISENVDIDAARGITAVWHDESHLNHHLQTYPPHRILDPSYCYPEAAGDHYLNKWRAAGINPTPRILALTKESR